jgi:hypothetical protein
MSEETLMVRWKGIDFAPIIIPIAIFDPEIHTLYEEEPAPAEAASDPPLTDLEDPKPSRKRAS